MELSLELKRDLSLWRESRVICIFGEDFEDFRMSLHFNTFVDAFSLHKHLSTS